MQGRLHERWTHWFHEMSITFEQAEDGSTVPVLAGSVVDQVVLYGSINRMCDLGLLLISVGRV